MRGRAIGLRLFCVITSVRTFVLIVEEDCMRIKAHKGIHLNKIVCSIISMIAQLKLLHSMKLILTT